MFFAVEPSTGVEISAESARAKWTYRCPTCGARVQVKRGPRRADHFAHVLGEADQACESYTPSRFEYQRRPPGEGRIVGPGIATSYLSFSMSIDGPRLAYWLPPAPGASWAGAIEFEAYQTSREFRASNLRYGQSIEFALVDGQWNVRDSGDVADEYLELLSRGRQSLDAAGAIFDASSAVGRQVLPGQSVAYGQELHWVTRAALDPQARGVKLCSVEKLCLVGGWHVYRVQLPDGAYTGDEFQELVQWLERRIRPARPKAWIESPWPWATTESGFLVYDPADGELVVRTDRSVDIRIADARTGRDVLVKDSRQNVSVQDLPEGAYDLFINDLPHETFVVEAGNGAGPAAVRIQLAHEEPVALAYAQPVLDALIASGRRSIPLQLTWKHPAVGVAVIFDGRVLGQEGAFGSEVLMLPGMRLDAGNLGSLEWSAEESAAAEPVRLFPSQLRERAKWLLSVAGEGNGWRSERVVVPDSLRDEGVFRRLASASWPRELGPQVRAMSRSLSEWR